MNIKSKDDFIEVIDQLRLRAEFIDLFNGEPEEILGDSNNIGYWNKFLDELEK